MNKSTIFALIGVLILGLSVGRYTAPVKTKVVEHTTTVEVEKKSTDLHQTTTITETKKPDGTDTKVTVITETKDTDVDYSKNTNSTTSTTKTYSDKSLHVYGLAAFNGLSSITYGAHVSKEILGPISVGAFGFTDGKFGVSVGLSF